MKKSILVVSLFCFLFVGCDYQQKIAQIEEQLKVTKNEIAALKTENDNLKKAIDDIEKRRMFDEFFRDFEKTAYLTPGAEGYQVIRFDLGALTVKIEDIKPYANGSKIALVFGNPLSSRINGLSAKIDWGKVNDKGGPINENSKTKEITISQELHGGCWTNVPIVLEGVPPSDLGFVRIKEMSHTGIELTTLKSRR